MRKRWERDGGLGLDHVLLSSALTKRLQVPASIASGQMTRLLPLWRSCFHRSRGRVEAEHAGYRLVADTGLYICRRRSRHAAFLRFQNRRPSIDGWGVGRNRGGGSHRGSPCPVLSAELAISLRPRLPAPTRARASSVPAASLFGIRRSSATPGRDRDR
jgi:hypothetical protein